MKSSYTWQEIAVTPDTQLRAALLLLDATASQFLVVVDNAGHLLGTLTDGDVRRALLRTADLDSAVETVMNPDPVSVPATDRLWKVRDLLRRFSVRAVPLVDGNGRVTDVVFEVSGGTADIRDTTVLVMAGGRGTRLLPLTKDVPKPLIRVGGVPIIETTVRRLREQGFVDVRFAINYLGEAIKEHFGDGEEFGIASSYIMEPSPLGTMGAAALLGSDTSDSVLVVNGDLVTSVDFNRLVEEHKSSGFDACLGVVQHRVEIPYGVVEQSEGRLLDIDEKPNYNFLVSSGISILNAESRAQMVPNTRYDAPDLMRRLVKRGLAVRVALLGEYWKDIGTHASLREAMRDSTGVEKI